jgi:hypothetical protein
VLSPLSSKSLKCHALALLLVNAVEAAPGGDLSAVCLCSTITAASSVHYMIPAQHEELLTVGKGLQTPTAATAMLLLPCHYN